MKRPLSPSTAALLGAGTLVLMSAITSVLGVVSPWLTLNENQILYLFSTTAQVVAAIYGLTLTGFLFFRNELTREANSDETLEDAINALKARYFKLLTYITFLVAITLALSHLVISHEASLHLHVTTILINVGQSAFAVSFAAIALFVFDVIAPQGIERASQSLQNEVDPSRRREQRGSLEQFLRNYNQIEALLSPQEAPFIAYEVYGARLNLPRKMSNARLVDLLFRSERISQSLRDRLRELITLRNSIIHGAEPIVSQEIVDTSASVLAELRVALGPEGQ